MTRQASTPDALKMAAWLEPSPWKDCRDAAVIIRQQHAELERLRANAARYRWLQEHTVVTGLSRWMGSRQFLDSAIDAAMRDAPNV